MSTIRRQSIISSAVIYSGFAVGMLNTYFFTRYFEEAQYGLTSIFIAIATMMYVFAMMATPSYIFKFYHYYNDHLPPRKNDMITWSLLVSLVGFLLVMIAGWFFKDVVIRKFGEKSPILLTYYYWIFPMGLGLTIYSVLEAYAWNLGKSVLTSFLKEVQWRLLTTVLIVLMITGIIKDFSLFIKLYAFTYPAIALTLFIYLVATKKIHFTFTVSKVSRRYFGKILRLCLFVYSGTLIFTLSQVFDTLVLAVKSGADVAGIFALAQIMGSVIQAPQRGIVAASISHLSKAWKEKNMELLQRIYQRSSINQLVFASGLFVLIALNYNEAILTFHLKETYLAGFSAFILLGLMRIVDMGTGVNAQIISTSNYWKFELISGVILLALMLPLTYFLTIKYGLIGPAIANLISITIYNIVRIVFLWKKFRLFPFTVQSLYTVLLAAGSFAICYYAFINLHGFAGLVARSIAFIALYSAGAIYMNLSPDIQPVWYTIQKRLGIKKG
ncbi:MAG: lipopolysaccharide biosynthesis protein [Chitinophagales bacterium]|nr:lipopolysaccharide biosynthesis protein [Chitinophagales bacterium]